MKTTEEDKAIAGAEMAVMRDTTNPEYLMQLGEAYFEAQRYAEAIATLRRAIDLDPGDARSHQLIGRAYLDGGQLDAAITAFQRAIDLDPEYVEPYVSLGVLYSWRTETIRRRWTPFSTRWPSTPSIRLGSPSSRTPMRVWGGWTRRSSRWKRRLVASPTTCVRWRT